jgi:hypothetical protein
VKTRKAAAKTVARPAGRSTAAGRAPGLKPASRKPVARKPASRKPVARKPVARAKAPRRKR